MSWLQRISVNVTCCPYLDLSGVVAVEDGGCVALEAEVVVEEGGAEERQVLELLQGHWLLHQLPGLHFMWRIHLVGQATDEL